MVADNGRVRTLLVDDSPLVLAVMARILGADPGIEVVGRAHDGKEALALVERLLPDVICTDFYMPVMDGLEFTREVMARFPTPILVISTGVGPEDGGNVFNLLEAGAVDVFPKPRIGFREEDAESSRELCRRIKMLSRIQVFRIRRPSAAAGERPVHGLALAADPVAAVAIGASAGGPQALAAVLGALEADFPVPILCAQHVAAGFVGGLVAWLATRTKLDVRLAKDGEAACAGRVYFAPDNAHLLLAEDLRLGLSLRPPHNGHRPSVDLLFDSLARQQGAAAVGVLLSGMGCDGAAGMRTIAQLGGMTFAQDEETSIVFGMPAEAIRLGAVRLVLPVGQIGPALNEYCRGRHAAATPPLQWEGK